MKMMTPTVPRLEPANALLPPIMSGHEAAVEEIVKAKNLIDAKQAQLAEAREGVERAAGDMRTAKEADGEIFSKTILVRGQDHNLAFVYTDSFSAIDVAAEAPLRALLGEHFETLFRRRQAVTVKEPERLLLVIGQLEALLPLEGAPPFAKGLKTGLSELRDLLKKEEYLSPVADFRLRRFELRKQLSAAQNVGLDAVIAQIASKPQMSVA